MSVLTGILFHAVQTRANLPEVERLRTDEETVCTLEEIVLFLLLWHDEIGPGNQFNYLTLDTDFCFFCLSDYTLQTVPSEHQQDLLLLRM